VLANDTRLKRASAQTIGQCIRQSRTNRGLSLRALADRAGISAPFLSDIELDRRNPSPKVAKKLAEQLWLTNDQLSEFDYRRDLRTLAGAVRTSPPLQAALRVTMRQLREGDVSPEQVAGALETAKPRKKHPSQT